MERTAPGGCGVRIETGVTGHWSLSFRWVGLTRRRSVNGVRECLSVCLRGPDYFDAFADARRFDVVRVSIASMSGSDSRRPIGGNVSPIDGGESRCSRSVVSRVVSVRVSVRVSTIALVSVSRTIVVVVVVVVRVVVVVVSVLRCMS